MAVDGDEPPAITDPTTRRTLRRGAWFAIGTITIGIAAFIAAGVAISGSNARYERLERDGARTVGTVVDFDRSGRGPASVAYEFTWDGDVHHERVSAIEADDYEVGDRVVILVGRGGHAFCGRRRGSGCTSPSKPGRPGVGCGYATSTPR